MAFNNIKEDLLRLPTYINFPKEEESILRYWQENNIFEKCQRKSLGQPVYSFYDGPPFATGLPHYGHILAGTIKDVMTRYAYQNGYHVERRFGWDCHGLPVEHEVDKEFGIKSSEDVMKLGIAKYNKRCREVVMRYAKEWQEVTERMGRWIDFENDYKTMYPTFMETVWWVFKQLYEKGLVYKGVKVMPYSTACTTPISNFEAGQNYRDVTENSIVVKFKAVDLEASFLIWTTTPWTLPANMALCVNPNLTYVKVKEEDTGELFILAKNRLEYIFKKRKFSIHDSFSGEHLKDTRYVPLFSYYQEYGRRMNAFRVLIDDYVESDSGSGIVHQAPFFGEDDYRICLSAGIIKKDGEIICPVNDAGLYTKDVPDFAGQYIKDADKQIVSLLKSRGDIFCTLQISHRYPYCWRSDTPLIYKAVPSWFIRVNHMSHELLKSCSKTHWVPEYVKEKRFANWLQNSRDWAVSRNRYWGTPIPIWMSDDGSEIVCIGSLKELEEKSGKKIIDLHREFIDDIKMPSAIPGNKPLKRVKEVFDCWFESGSMPYGQLHYPFENTENFTQSFPADFIAEGIDQTRGWFYTLLVISNVLFGKAPYKNVIVNGLVLAADGQKMSKSKKNFPDPMEVVNKYGADALRLYLINSPVVKGENLRFTEEGVHGVTKDVFLPWYNSFRFFIQNVERLDKENSLKFLYNSKNYYSAVNSTSLLDQWILSAKENMIKFVADELQHYRLYTILPRLLKFLDNLTNWYVRLSKPSLKGELSMQNCLNSMNTLYDILFSITKLMAPFAPFLAEYFYQRLAIFNEDTPKESVHFLIIPTANLQFIKQDVEASISRMQNVILLGRMIRERHNLALKYPVRNVTVIQSNPTFMQDINPLKDFIIRELNTKSISFSTDKRKFGIVTSAQADYKSLGLRLKKDLNPVAQAIRSLNEDDIETYMKSESFTICGHEISPSEIRLFYCISPEFDSSKEYGIQGDSNILILIDLTVEKEFEEEGLAREIINRIQKLKKRIQLIPTDQVLVYYTDYSQNQVLTSVCKKYKNFIENIIKSPFDVLSASNSQNIITSDKFQLKEGTLKITICSLQVANLPVVDWCNVTLHPEIQERYTTGRKASLLLQKLDSSYLSLDELKSEIINIFGLYDLDLVLICDGRKFRDVKFAARKIITVCKPQHKIKTMDVITHPFSRFVNCQLGEIKYTVFLENPSDSGKERNLSDILDLVFPNVPRENIVLSEW